MNPFNVIKAYPALFIGSVGSAALTGLAAVHGVVGWEPITLAVAPVVTGFVTHWFVSPANVRRAADAASVVAPVVPGAKSYTDQIHAILEAASQQAQAEVLSGITQAMPLAAPIDWKQAADNVLAAEPAPAATNIVHIS